MHLNGSLHARENNFDFLRLFAASLVLLVHSYPLTGRRPEEPIELLTGYENGGSFAVSILLRHQRLSDHLVLAEQQQPDELPDQAGVTHPAGAGSGGVAVGLHHRPAGDDRKYR